MSDELISTGEAAELLGVTPRTVARMVDRGDLPGYRIGRHRRIRRSSLPAAGGHRPGLEFRRLLGIVLAAAVIEDPDRALELARANLRRQRDRPTQSTSRTDQWAALIDAGDLPAIIDGLTDAGDRSGLRQTHPFAGLISQRQREAALTLART